MYIIVASRPSLDNNIETTGLKVGANKTVETVKIFLILLFLKPD